MSEDRSGYVYLLKASKPFEAVYKIGCSSRPRKRLKTFAVRLPFKVELVALTRYTRMFRAEKAWHNKFGHRRLDGEWFALSREEVNYIRTAFLSAEAIVLVAKLESVRPIYESEEAVTYFIRLGKWAKVLAKAVDRYKRRAAKHGEWQRIVKIDDAIPAPSE